MNGKKKKKVRNLKKKLLQKRGKHEKKDWTTMIKWSRTPLRKARIVRQNVVAT